VKRVVLKVPAPNSFIIKQAQPKRGKGLVAGLFGDDRFLPALNDDDTPVELQKQDRLFFLRIGVPVLFALHIGRRRRPLYGAVWQEFTSTMYALASA
jgi:hypothetical protein